MCGRFTQQITWRELRDLYKLSAEPEAWEIKTRYNGAPTQAFAVCRLNSQGDRSVSLLRWGLVPFWATEKSFGSRLINARAESVNSKPSFRNAFRSRRCLVPASGWFEWSRVGTKKQPYFIESADEEILSFAGIWELWDKEGTPMETFSIITTAATPKLSDIHHRQPAVIPQGAFDDWFDPSSSATDLLKYLNNPDASSYRYYAVSTRVNNVRNDAADILEPSNTQDLFNT